MSSRHNHEWNTAFHWAFGRGFWYTDPIKEIEGLSDEQLFWVPTQKSLCALWHVGHIAHRERFHIGWFLEGLRNGLIPPEFDVFGPEWVSAGAVRDAVDSVEKVRDWVRNVRATSHEYIASLAEEDFHKVPQTSDEGHTVAQVLMQTAGHTAVHIGRIQMLRAMLKNKKERAC